MGKAEAVKSHSVVKTRYERWQETIDTAIKDSRWHGYDCDIQRTVTMFNLHLSGDGYRPLDWRLIKAMIWTESGGPSNPEWKNNPMQIGNEGDPGLRALLFGNEGGELIMPATLRQRLNITSVANVPRFNIEAGTAYLLMRHARYDIRTVRDISNKKIHTIVVQAGDSLDKIARKNETTVDILKQHNAAALLQRGKPCNMRRVIYVRSSLVGSSSHLSASPSAITLATRTTVEN
jgi:hypothetical protein